jgi:hypothetical protein
MRSSIFITSFLLWSISPALQAGDYDFDVGEYDKKPWKVGGYVGYSLEHQSLDTSASFYTLQFNGSGLDTNLRRQLQLELNASYNRDKSSVNFIGYGYVLQESRGDSNALSIYELYYARQASVRTRYEVGKRSLKWGKGYAWNPVGFIERDKDPLEPELNREGYIIANYDYVKSGGERLRTWGINLVLLPVSQQLNSDYGSEDIHFAAKLYLLYRDNDIDLVFMDGQNSSPRFGVDISRNLATNFEIHAEWSRSLNYAHPVLQADLSLSDEIINADSWLLGIRYLTESNLTLILERFHNGGGYSPAQMQYFYSQVSAATLPGEYADLRAASAAGYGGVFAMQDYIYLRLIQKEPFGLIYWTPTFTLIHNLADNSRNIGIDINYIGIDNLELHFRSNRLIGNSQTEYGEKPADLRVELEGRYYF